MTEKLHLTRVFRTDTDKNKQPLVGRSGKPYSKIAIKCVEYGDKWVNGFGNRDNERWQDGDEVVGRVVKNGEYLNLERVGELEQVMERLTIIENKLDMLVKGGKPQPDYLTGEMPKVDRYAEPTIDESDLPF